MQYVIDTMSNLAHQTAFFNLTWGNYLMIAVACVFLFLAIKKGFEPLLLVPIAFGMLLVNIYPDIMLSPEESANGVGGLLHYFYILEEFRYDHTHSHLLTLRLYRRYHTLDIDRIALLAREANAH